MIPLAIPNIGKREGEFLQVCVDENYVSSVGRFVTQFEGELAKLSGTESAVAVSSGTQALHLALHALGVTHGDLVIVPSFTFIGSANAISHCGASPWFVDIDEKNWTLSADAVEEALATKTERTDRGLIHKATGRRVAAIMPVYTLGTVAAMDRLGAIARAYGLKTVADAAAAIGVTFQGRPIGLFADLTTYSFNGNKTITTGGGGAVTGPDAALVKRVKHLSSTARTTPDYDHDEVGFNYRMTNIEAAIGCAQMERLPEFLAMKRQIRDRYDAAFGDVAGVRLFPRPANGEGVFWFSGLIIDDERLPRVKDLCMALKERGVEARPFWKPVHNQPPYRTAPAEALDVTENLWSKIITLPCSTSLTEAEQTHVIDSLKPMLVAR
jgi:Predicted pyridoxal phosphate-dependent enzyme apparently involved in regulation of cell wall biogenesis